MPPYTTSRGKGNDSVRDRSGSDDDEFPDVDLIVQRYQKSSQTWLETSRSTSLDNGTAQATVNVLSGRDHDVEEKRNESGAAVKATPLRRRKLGRGQTVDGSLLKPWNDASDKMGSRLSKHRSNHSRTKGLTTDVGGVPEDAPEPVPATVRQGGPGAIARNTTQGQPSESVRGLEGNLRGGDESRSRTGPRRSRQRQQPSSGTPEERSGTLKNTAHSHIDEEEEEEEEEVSEFNSASSSESDSWDSASELPTTPTARRSRSPTIQRLISQPSPLNDKNKVAAPSKELQRTMVGPTKRAVEKAVLKGALQHSLNASQRGSLDDVFQKLQIFNEDSESDEPIAKGGKNPVTGPPTPKKTLLASPSKRPKIPASPWNPQQGEFWDPEANFGWIDKHSPEKPEGSRPSQSQSAPDNDGKAPGPKRKHAVATVGVAKRDARKAFDVTKEELARSFLQELDENVTDGQLTRMTAETGGLRIEWSNTLLTTAGRAHWKCKTMSTATKHADGTVEVRKEEVGRRQHHAHIELASKVLANETDLLNTVAHEFCHLAVFMLDGKPRAAHGPEFKAWGRRCGRAFAHRGIEVTTRHSYEIEYKYVWRCAGCAAEVKRHSKSVNPERQRCGACRGYLHQIKPTPRGGDPGQAAPGAAAGREGKDVTAKKKPNAWQEFMAREMKALSQTGKGVPFGERMAIVSAKWNELQQQQKKK
ncbi:SprT-like family-domain-containing protein [Durotheca rogersii]|uniref:SprT-like family-domain-containing protein n=1 Tax=Durotheca rogersii TaxID=419775 RepID=UPI00221FC19F|nr:SprT-like family-domain-containing protein [Durotheca rogersii]KAI5854479.1 SprT-like family-domain-containing protein [Durotheca rogersii]